VTLAGFLVSTTIALAIKYLITTSIAFALWSSGEPPPLPHGRYEAAAVARTAPIPKKRSPVDVPRTTIEGTIVADDGTPIEGAWVYLDGNVGVFDATSLASVEIGVHDHQFSPEVVVVNREQPLVFRSDDSALHTVRGIAADGTPAFHYPLVPGKEPAPVRVAYASGRIELSCAVHESANTKHRGAVIVLDHPFFTRSGKDGRFRLEHVPAGAGKVVAITAGGVPAQIRP
jgi:hypothetical protein